MKGSRPYIKEVRLFYDNHPCGACGNRIEPGLAWRGKYRIRKDINRIFRVDKYYCRKCFETAEDLKQYILVLIDFDKL